MSQRHDEEFDWEKQVGVGTFHLRPKNPRWAVWAGYIASQCAGLGALAVITAIFTRFDWNRMSQLGAWTAGILGFSQFFLVPFGMGIVAAYFWVDTVKVSLKESGLGDAKAMRRKRPLVGGAALLNTLISCCGATLVLREGAICLLMAAPLLWLFMWMGMVTGDQLWRKYSFLSVSLLPLFLLVVCAEAGRTPSSTLQVSTRFHSSASPQALWRYTANYPRNPHPPRWWLYRLGLPAPMQSTGQPRRGGRRDCLLSGGIDIGEKIVVAQRNRKLEFVIDRQPQHPEITHHFILERGRIELSPDGQGGTWLTGTSWYRLNVAPVDYFDLWAAAVVHQTHERVFEWMDELARRG